MASRCALRLLPLLNTFSSEKRFRTDLLSPVCRAVAISTVASTWHSALIVDVEDAADAAYDAQDFAIDAAYAAGADPAYNPGNTAADAAVNAAGSAESAVESVRRSDENAYSSACARTAAMSIVETASYVGEDLWNSVRADLRQIKLSKEAFTLMQLPVWPDGMPEKILADWMSLKTTLPENESWWVWTDWYEGQLNGTRNRNVALELTRASIQAKDWDRGPRHVNRLLAKIERKYGLE